jgi:DNA-binding XRE family transcriptional regulator
MAKKRYTQEDGQRLFEEHMARAFADPKFRARYEKEARKKELWLQLVEARLEAGLTQKDVAKRMGISQAQVARIEKRGYEAHTLRTLQRYIEALGNRYKLVVSIQKNEDANTLPVEKRLQKIV